MAGRGAHGSGPARACSAQPPGSWRTTRRCASTATPPGSLSRGNRRHPFNDDTYPHPNRVFTKPELLGYIDWCRGRVSRTLDTLTEKIAARPPPRTHRYQGTRFGVIAGSMPLHVVEHACQIRQFLTATGVKVQPMPGDRGYAGEPRQTIN